MRARRPVILLTGFGPFPGVPENASTILVPRLADAARQTWPSHEIAVALLPTEWAIAPHRVAALVAELRPAVALHFGVSSRCSGFVLETRGLNRARPLPDAAGCLPSSERIAHDGPDFLAAGIPVARIVERLRQRKVPARLSRDAGGYLCNAVFYSSLYAARNASLPVRSGFIHLPSRLARPVPSNRHGLDWEQALRGGLEIVAATIVTGGACASRAQSERAPVSRRRRRCI